MKPITSTIREHLDDLEAYITYLEAENENLRKIIIKITDGTDQATDGINGDAE